MPLYTTLQHLLNVNVLVQIANKAGIKKILGMEHISMATNIQQKHFHGCELPRLDYVSQP
jgi:hypothetical protein